MTPKADKPPETERPAGDRRLWPAHLLGGRVRTSTVVLIVAFVAVWWVYDNYRAEPTPPAAPQVVPPGFIPDPAYTWVPRTRLQQPPATVTETVTPTPTTTEPPEPPEPGSEPGPSPGFPFCPPLCPPAPPSPPPGPVPSPSPESSRPPAPPGAPQTSVAPGPATTHPATP